MVGSGIKHPGSATLVYKKKIPIPALVLKFFKHLKTGRKQIRSKFPDPERNIPDPERNIPDWNT
jgi:hypothetical protein